MSAAIFFAIYLATQVAVPTWKLFEARPARFGWQMFSGYNTTARFGILKTDGTEVPVELRDHVGNPRGDLQYELFLPAHLCRLSEETVAVVIYPAYSSNRRVYSCP